MALFTFGEGYHNYHHEFQHDYRNGVKPWQWEPDQMADLDSIQAPINERSPSSAAGDDLLRPDAPARFATQSDKLSSS